MFEELQRTYPGFTHFYEVVGLNMPDAMERCARMTGQEGYVVNHNFRIIFCVRHDLGPDIDFLTPIPPPAQPEQPE